MVMAQTQPVQHWELGVGPITCHAWNKDRSKLAVSPNSSDVLIFEWRQGKWTQTDVLGEHDLSVTAIDWAPNTDRIVTCSHDKNAFVYTQNKGVWKPNLVLVRLDRAATCVKWSPQENKFAVGSAAKLVAVCHYETDNDWWVAKQIKKGIRSVVLSLDWHPNNCLLAVGACDFKTRVFSAFVKDVDSTPTATPWGKQIKFGELVSEYNVPGSGWIHSVRFSPSGCRLAFASHDSSLSVCDAQDSDSSSGATNAGHPERPARPRVGSVKTIKEWYLPFNVVEWATENSIIAAGHDCCPMLFSFENDQLKFVSKLDVPSEQKVNKFTAMDKFRNMDKVAVSSVDTSVKTLHQNQITSVQIHSGSRQAVTKFSTAGIDGLVALWDLKALESSVKSIRLA